METSACSTSNIRLLRVVNFSSRFTPYYEQLARDSLFHHTFWHENNQLFNALSSPSEHPEFILQRSKKFREYHAECWKRNLRTIGIGLKCLFSFKKAFKYAFK